MNDTQILFGYIQLKKFDNLRPYMEKIKMTMQQESNLSKLGIPSFIAYLLQFRVQSKTLELEVEVEQEINLGQLPLHDGLIERLVRQMVECVQEQLRHTMMGKVAHSAWNLMFKKIAYCLILYIKAPINGSNLKNRFRTHFSSKVIHIRLRMMIGKRKKQVSHYDCRFIYNKGIFGRRPKSVLS